MFQPENFDAIVISPVANGFKVQLPTKADNPYAVAIDPTVKETARIQAAAMVKEMNRDHALDELTDKDDSPRLASFQDFVNQGDKTTFFFKDLFSALDFIRQHFKQ